MSENSHKVFPLKRIAAAIYDLLLLLGVWFASGSIAVWINGGIIESKWIENNNYYFSKLSWDYEHKC